MVKKPQWTGLILFAFYKNEGSVLFKFFSNIKNRGSVRVCFFLPSICFVRFVSVLNCFHMFDYFNLIHTHAHKHTRTFNCTSLMGQKCITKQCNPETNYLSCGMFEFICLKKTHCSVRVCSISTYIWEIGVLIWFGTFTTDGSNSARSVWVRFDSHL